MSTLYRLVAVAGLIAAGSLLGSTVGAQATDHCPDHQGHPGKVELTDDSTYSVTLPDGTEFCVKAGTGASGKLTSDGNEWTVDWLNRGGQTPAISYYVIYSEPGDPGNGDDNGTDPGNGNGTDPGNGNGDPGNGDNGNGPPEVEIPEPETPVTPEPETPEPETPVTPEPETGQLPPPGTDEPVTVPVETEPVQLPPTPEVGADPPSTATPTAAEPELTELPETGAAVAVTSAFGLALLALGVGLRRFAR